MTGKLNERPGCLSIFAPILKHFDYQSRLDRMYDSNDLTITSDRLPYRLRDDFLSPAEFSFYKILSTLVSPRFSIQSKVRLADIFFVARPNENLSYFNKIAQLHLDFLVCDSTTMKPLFGIELDDASHKRTNRQERDEFFEEVFLAGEFPLLRIPVQREYTLQDVKSLIAPYLANINKVSGATSLSEEDNQAASIPLCPKCGVPMVLRTATQGDHKGKQFYGCQNYPRCREVKPVITK